MCASPAARRRARELCRELEPFLAEMVERNDPSVESLSFDDIEPGSAAAGDLVARAMILRALASQPEPTTASGRLGDRLKYARMRWTPRRADAMHAVKAAIMSEDHRWQRRWPGPVPILETTLSPAEGN
jgi:hypothetical protein